MKCLESISLNTDPDPDPGSALKKYIDPDLGSEQ